jgi:outer membrane lipoprotein
MVMKMPQILLLFILSLMFLSCSPVLNREYMREGSREVSFQLLRENPEAQKGRLFILGGVIVRTKFTAAGSQIEAMYVPVNGSGYFKESGRSEGRFLAVLPEDRTMLDPEVYSRGRRVTLAGEFVELQSGWIGEMEYVYPVFEIKQIYLWPMENPYYPAPYYYYDPWFYPYPYYYWDPWWSYPYYYRYYPAPPVYQRTPPPNRAPTPSPSSQPPQRRGLEREREQEQR